MQLTLTLTLTQLPRRLWAAKQCHVGQGRCRRIDYMMQLHHQRACLRIQLAQQHLSPTLRISFRAQSSMMCPRLLRYFSPCRRALQRAPRASRVRSVSLQVTPRTTTQETSTSTTVQVVTEFEAALQHECDPGRGGEDDHPFTATV